MSNISTLSDNVTQERLRLLSDNLPHSYLYQIIHLPNGRPQFLFVSSGVLAVHGVTPEEVMADANCIFSRVHPESMPEMLRKQDEAWESMCDFHIEVRARHSDGSWRWIELRSRPSRTSNSLIVWNGVANDITEQHEARLKAKHLTERTKLLLDLQQLEEDYDERGFMQQVLNRVEALTRSEIGFMHFVNEDQESIELVAWSNNTLDKYCHAAFDNHYPISQAGIWADAARQRAPVVINDYANARNKRGLPEGHSELARLISVPVITEDEVHLMTGVGNKRSDYTELDVETLLLVGNETWRIVSRRRMEKALRIASQVVNASPVICFRWRAEANWPVEFVSENITQWGYSVEKIQAGTPSFAQMIHPEDFPRVAAEVTGYTENGLNTFLQEYRLIGPKKQVFWVEDRTIVRRDASGKPIFYDGVLSDISERKHRQDSMNTALAAQRQLNKRLEEAHNQLLQSEKMASIGQLAAGIAHELNNPIGFVHSNMGTLEGYLRDLMDIIDAYDSCAALLDKEAPQRLKIQKIKEERDYQYVRDDIFSLLAESKDGLGRVRKIVQDLKSFSHVGEQEWQPADLHQGLDSTLNIVWNELKYKCTVRKEYSELPKVFCLISQLNQVFMNLLVNAGHAIESKGEITIRTRLHEENSVLIEICDTGKGIQADHLNRIFDPFFTTKPVGKGTGLGLSLSYSIIQRHHGRIEVTSEVGKGSCFRIIIPIEQPKAGSTPPAPENPS